MGTVCPKCGTHQAFVSNITADGKPPRTGNDVIIRVLACGHRLGAAEYVKYEERRAKILVAKAEAIEKITAEANTKLAAAFTDVLEAKEAA